MHDEHQSEPAASGRPRVFVSSVSKEPNVPGSEKRVALRGRIRDIAEQAGVDTWVAEHDAPGLADAEWPEIIDVCIDEILRSDLVIVLLLTRAGDRIEIGGEHGFCCTSVFEVELFYASLNLKPACFFVVGGYEPEPELDNLIRLLRLADSGNWFVGSEPEIESRLRDLFVSLHDQKSPAWSLPNFCDLASSYKSYRGAREEIRSERLSLIGRFRPVASEDFSFDRVQHLLALAEEADSRTAQFSRLWMALRELSKRGLVDPHDSNGDLWLKLARKMPSIAAWLGLHGPLDIGVTAAYQTQNELRRRGVLREESFPFGGFASESYSVGLRHRDARLGRLRFRAAERLATDAVVRRPSDPSGALLTRGSARLQLARLGRPWLIRSGLSDFREACRIRERIGASQSVYGEALVSRGVAEFAIARVLHVGRRKALDTIREGVNLLERTGDTRVGFVVSAKRKFADALEAAGRLDEADQQRKEAIALASDHGIVGQLGRLQQAR